MRAYLLGALLAAACSSSTETHGAAARRAGEEPAPAARSVTSVTGDAGIDAMTTRLPADLEAELAAIRSDPKESVGFGFNAIVPYQPTGSRSLINSDDPQVTRRLLEEARAGGDRTYRLAVLQVLGKHSDPTVDDALVALLAVDDLRATAAYLLGRAGYKGYPPRRRDLAAVRAALRAHLDDDHLRRSVLPADLSHPGPRDRRLRAGDRAGPVPVRRPRRGRRHRAGVARAG